MQLRVVLTIIVLSMVSGRRDQSAKGSFIVEVDIDVKKYLHQARSDFLSVALDSSLIETDWLTFDPTNAGVIAMLKGLSPAILRLGGTACDYVIFNDTFFEPTLSLRKSGNTSSDNGEKSILKHSDWDKLVQLSRIANLTLLFDVNVMIRDSLGQWDPSNFMKFLNYNEKKGYSNLMFELGNEPNNYPSHFNKTITAAQLATDFSLMKKILQTSPMYKESLIVGADVGNPYISQGELLFKQ